MNRLSVRACLFVLLVGLSTANAQEKPALVVVISVDQFAYQYLERFESNYPSDGLVRQCRDAGVWYSDCKHQHAITKTGPGHAVQLTGTYPNRHGIIANDWFDRELGKLTYCVRDPEAILIGAETTDAPVSPKLLLADTVGDQLKLATGGKSKVFTVAIKDRAAILMAGRTADSAVWMSNQGSWISTDHYGRTLPQCVAELNADQAIQKYGGAVWEPLFEMSKYKHGATEVSTEERPINEMTRDFPHKMPAADHKFYIKNLACSPFGNVVTLDAAKAIIVREELGKDNYPDLLGINLSANDYVGHAYGPDSLEVEDICYRTDRQLGDFMRFIYNHLGTKKFVLFVTSDHGVAPVPEIAARKKLRAGRDPLGKVTSGTGNIADMETQLEAYLGERLEYEIEEDDKMGIVQAFTEFEVFLNHDHPALAGWSFEFACRLTRDWVLAQPHVVAAMTRDQLLGDTEDSQLSNLMRRSFHARRSGDVMFVIQPYFINGTAATTHGSPWHYDRHVPLMVVGDVHRSCVGESVSPASIATTISRLLRIEFPSMSGAPPLDDVKLR